MTKAPRAIRTHLGRFEVEVVGCLTPDLTGSGVTSYTAANGDELSITFIGSATIDPVAGTITFSSTPVATDGTGRFEGAVIRDTGEAIDVASLATGEATGYVDGTITFNAANRSN